MSQPVRCGCGGEAILQIIKANIYEHWYRILCPSCYVQTKAYYSEAEAIEVWNRAMGVTDTNVEDKFAKDINVPDKERKKGRWKNVAFLTRECSECGAQFHELEYDNFCPNCGTAMTDGDIPMEYFESGGK